MMTGNVFRARFDQARELLADDRTHRAAEKAEIHDAERNAMPADHSDPSDDRVFEIRFLEIGCQLVLVRCGAGKAQHIYADHLRVHFLERARFDHGMNALAGADGEMMPALPADFEVLVEFLVENHRLALGTFRPKTFGDFAFLGFRAGPEFELFLNEAGGVVVIGWRRQGRFNRVNADGFLGKRGCGHGQKLSCVGRSWRKVHFVGSLLWFC